MSHTPALDGTLHVLPFDSGSLATRVADIYTTALESADGDPRNVLVLKRLPTGIDEFTAALRDAAELEGRPNVKSLPRHAGMVLEEAEPEITRLGYEERIEFLARVLDGFDWSPYFERASEHDSFGRDVGQVLLDATWNGGFDVTPDAEAPLAGTDDEREQYDAYLRELAAVNDAFHERLAERDLLEQAQTIERAIDALDRTAIRAQIEREFDVVLAVEFEECGELDREYLATLTRNVDLLCVGEEHASIERTKTESGSVRELAPALTVVDHTDESNAETTPSVPGAETETGTGTEMAGRAFGSFLATGGGGDRNGTVAGDGADGGDGDGNTVKSDPGTGANENEAYARLISEPTLDQQVEAVANEIEFLRAEHGWEYDEFAVLLRHVGNPMPRVRRVLQHAGVPTASAGVNGLEQDLAVRELHALAQYHIDDSERAYDLLDARVPELDENLIQGCVVRNSVAQSLKRWIVTTDLKRRIAADTESIDAREQFQNVSRLLSIAEFVDGQDILAGDWIQFVTMLERAITYDAPYAHTAAVSVPEGGVTVGDVGLLKNDSRTAVFLLNVVDGEYPGEETLSPLFPTAWIKQMGGYPAVTNPSAADVAATYATVETADIAGNAFERYHDERARRQLAIGARAAEEQLYFCTYRQTDGSIGRLQHRSRYLHAIEDCPHLRVEEVAGVGTDRDIHTLGSASTEILAQPWTELERIQAEASTGGDVELESTEETLAAIQRVLETRETVDSRFERAVETQFDLARGAVRPAAGQRVPHAETETETETETVTNDD
ncbi:hypothetical protein [Natrialba aegyptia]|uniref:UvrD/REP helicase n=1 Tax=Natrialba aegyptia DSM 13077 TaxID=1227491 RepID=M0BB26_9EURY|nr:hypothetical protein [Natrialba aegyptia]ELZ08000.1 hypothetical protein C480_04064 [Natrialba aegyptia DSM 13077]